jgi:hypothetical protein
MLLGSYTSSGFDAHVVGDAKLHNTGNIGLVVTVKVHWDQAGEGPLKGEKTVRLAVGQSKTVHFKQSIDQAQIESIQSAQLSGSGDFCGVKTMITDTFGEAQ